MVYRYNSVTPFGKKGQEVSPPPPPDPFLRQTPGALSSHEQETPYPMKGKYRNNGNSSTAWVYTFLVVVISSIYEVGFDLAGDAFFATGLYNKLMVCSTAPWKCQSGQSILHDISAPLAFHADAGDNSDPYPPPVTTTLSRVSQVGG